MPPPGFRGLDPNLPVYRYTRHLPHWRQEGATYFVTFRLADALPREKLDDLKYTKLLWEQKNPSPTDQDWQTYARTVLRKTERWLDEGYGSCCLKSPESSGIVASSLHHFEGSRYSLFSYVMMPNHVHLVVCPMQSHKLEAIIKSWKRFTATRINQHEEQSGSLWQEEYFDRIVRDVAHLRRILKYIQMNPQKAGVSAQAWLAPDWRAWYDA